MAAFAQRGHFPAAVLIDRGTSDRKSASTCQHQVHNPRDSTCVYANKCLNRIALNAIGDGNRDTGQAPSKNNC